MCGVVCFSLFVYSVLLFFLLSGNSFQDYLTVLYLSFSYPIFLFICFTICFQARVLWSHLRESYLFYINFHDHSRHLEFSDIFQIMKLAFLDAYPILLRAPTNVIDWFLPIANDMYGVLLFAHVVAALTMVLYFNSGSFVRFISSIVTNTEQAFVAVQRFADKTANIKFDVLLCLAIIVVIFLLPLVFYTVIYMCFVSLWSLLLILERHNEPIGPTFGTLYYVSNLIYISIEDMCRTFHFLPGFCMFFRAMLVVSTGLFILLLYAIQTDMIKPSHYEPQSNNRIDDFDYQEKFESKKQNKNGKTKKQNKNISITKKRNTGAYERKAKMVLSDDCEVPDTGLVVGHTSLFLNLESLRITDSEDKRKKKSQLQPSVLLRSIRENLEILKQYSEFNLFNVDGSFKYDFETKLSDTEVGDFLPSWATKLRFVDLTRILESFKIHGLSAQVDHPYTRLRTMIVNYCLEHWCYSNLDFLGTFALILSICPTAIPTVPQDSADQYPLDKTYSYQFERDFNCLSFSYGVLGDEIVFGEANFLHEVFDHKRPSTTRVKVVGVVNTLRTKHSDMHNLVSELKTVFPPFQSVFDFDGKKRAESKLIYRRKSKGAWFVNLLPRESFYFNHVSGDFATYNVIKRLVQHLVNQIELFARRYLHVAIMDNSERKDLAKARSNKFRDFLRSTECQVMFASGMSKKAVADYVYKTKVSELSPLNIKSSVSDNVFNRRKMESSKSIVASRREKYAEMYEPENRVYMVNLADSASYIHSGLQYVSECLTYIYMFVGFIFCYTFYGSFTRFMGVVTRWLQAVNRVETTMDRVSEGIASWSPMAIFSIDREKNPEAVLNLLEFKFLLHMIYEWQYGSNKNLVFWASNFCITRAQSAMRLASVLTTIRPRAQTDELELEASNGVDIFAGVIDLLKENGIDKFTDADLRRANAEFQYRKNAAKDVSDKLSFASNVIRVVSTTLFGFDPINRDFQEFSSSALFVINETKRLVTKPPVTNAEHQVVVDLYERNSKLQTNPYVEKLPTYFRQVFNMRLSQLESMASESYNTLYGDKARIEPVVIMLSGKPKSGKTTALNFIKQMIAHKLNNGVIDNFSFNPDTEYFEGYRNNMFVTMDDAFTMTDTQLRADQIAVFNNMVNSNPYCLNMAFEGKGKKFFNSQFILVTSNAIGEGIKFDAAVTDLEAFMRRIHIHAVRDETRTDYLDSFKIVKCDDFPGVVGKLYTPPQLAKLMLRLRVVAEERYNSFRNIPADMFDFGAYDLPGVPEPDQVVVENREQNQLLHYSPTQYIAEFFSAFDGFGWWKPEYIKTLVIIFLTIATISVATKFFFAADDADDIDVESHDERRRKKGPKSKARKERWQKLKAVTNFRVQNGPSDEVNGLAQLSKCVVQFTTSYISNGLRYVNDCCAIHVGNNVYMYPAHFHADIDDVEIVSFKVVMSHGTYEVDYDVENIKFFEGMDMQFIKLDTDSFKPNDGSKFMLADSNDPVIMDLIPGTFVSLVKRGADGVESRQGALEPTGNPVAYSCAGQRMIVEQPIRYAMNSTKGDSGAAIVYVDGRGRNWILGMHVGKTSILPTKSIGVAIPVAKDMLIEAVSYFQAESFVRRDFPFPVKEYVLCGVRIPRKSKIRRSPLFEYRTPTQSLPAQLSPFEKDGVLVDPAILSLRKLSMKHAEVADFDGAAVKEYLFKLYPRSSKYSFLLTWEQVINGDTYHKIPSIDGTTSPGYPYCLSATKGKAPHIYLNENDTHSYSAEFLSEIELMDSNLNKGVNISCIWTDVLKDETRPIEKVKMGKTRLIATCPVHFLVLCRKYFQSFVTYVQLQAAYKPVSVGINVHSMHWKVLYDRFKISAEEDGWSLLSGDFENYDGNVSAKLGRLFIDYVNEWYDDGQVNATIRILLFKHIMEPTRLFENITYDVTGGNPSGNPITSIYNSFVQIIMWYIVFVDEFQLTTRQFDLAVYGDDNLVLVQKPNVTTKTMEPIFKKYFSMTYTHSTKAQVDVIDNIETVTYLGRSFVKFCNQKYQHMSYVVLAPLSLQTIYEIVYFYRGKQSQMEVVLLQACRSVKIELSHFDRETYNLELSKLLQALEERCSPVLSMVAQEILMEETYDDLFKNKYIGDGLPMYSNQPRA